MYTHTTRIYCFISHQTYFSEKELVQFYKYCNLISILPCTHTNVDQRIIDSCCPRSNTLYGISLRVHCYRFFHLCGWLKSQALWLSGYYDLFNLTFCYNVLCYVKCILQSKANMFSHQSVSAKLRNKPSVNMRSTLVWVYRWQNWLTLVKIKMHWSI